MLGPFVMIRRASGAYGIVVAERRIRQCLDRVRIDFSVNLKSPGPAFVTQPSYQRTIPTLRVLGGRSMSV
jgi:hypothetical protein